MDPRVDRTREAVLAAVRELLVEEGWDSVTHHRVALHSGVGRTTVYRHWPDRTELVREAMEFELISTRGFALTGDLRADLINTLHAIRYELIEREGARFLIVMIEKSEFDESMARLKKILTDRALETLRQVLREATERGELDAYPSIEDSVATLVGPLLMRRLVTHDPIEPNVVARLVDDFIASRCR